MKWSIGWAVIAALGILAAGVRAQETGSAKQGMELAREVCAECHAVESGQIFSPNPKAPTFDDIAGTPGMTATALSVALRTPHRDMPDLILSSEQISAISAYILSLKNGL